MPKKLVLIVAALGAFAVVGCQKPMTEFTSPEYKFKATFPGAPKQQEKTEAGLKFKVYSTEARNGAYMVMVSDIPIPANEPDEELQARLDGAQDGAVRGAGGTLKTSTKITLDGKYPGREFSARITQPANGQVRVRIYIVGSRVYQVMVIGTDGYATSTEADTFLNSFKLVP